MPSPAASVASRIRTWGSWRNRSPGTYGVPPPHPTVDGGNGAGTPQVNDSGLQIPQRVPVFGEDHQLSGARPRVPGVTNSSSSTGHLVCWPGHTPAAMSSGAWRLDLRPQLLQGFGGVAWSGPSHPLGPSPRASSRSSGRPRRTPRTKALRRTLPPLNRFSRRSRRRRRGWQIASGAGRRRCRIVSANPTPAFLFSFSAD